MTVTVTRHGGVGGIPRRWSATAVGTEATEWLSLVRDGLNQPRRPTTVADGFEYLIEVDDGSRTVTTRVPEHPHPAWVRLISQVRDINSQSTTARSATSTGRS